MPVCDETDVAWLKIESIIKCITTRKRLEARGKYAKDHNAFSIAINENFILCIGGCWRLVACQATWQWVSSAQKAWKGRKPFGCKWHPLTRTLVWIGNLKTKSNLYVWLCVITLPNAKTLDTWRTWWHSERGINFSSLTTRMNLACGVPGLCPLKGRVGSQAVMWCRKQNCKFKHF